MLENAFKEKLRLTKGACSVKYDAIYFRYSRFCLKVRKICGSVDCGRAATDAFFGESRPTVLFSVLPKSENDLRQC